MILYGPSGSSIRNGALYQSFKWANLSEHSAAITLQGMDKEGGKGKHILKQPDTQSILQVSGLEICLYLFILLWLGKKVVEVSLSSNNANWNEKIFENEFQGKQDTPQGAG